MEEARRLLIFCIAIGIGAVAANTNNITRTLDFDCQQNETLSMLICQITAEELTSDETDIIPANISSNVMKLKFKQHRMVNHLPSSIFTQCQKLKFFEAHDVFLIELKEETLQNATNLVEFKCNGNQIEELVDYLFKGAPNLEVIEFYGNKITNIHGKAFDGLTKLTFLQLGSNSIQRLGRNSFESLVSLKKLFMHHGKLKFISRDLFKNTVEMEEIYMDSQNINFIQKNFTENMKKLKILRLSGNPCLTMRNYWEPNPSIFRVEVTMGKLEECYKNYDQIRDDLSICDEETAERLNKVTDEKNSAEKQIIKLKKDLNSTIDQSKITEQNQKEEMEAKIRNLQKHLNSTIDQAKISEQNVKEVMETKIRNLYIVIVLLSLFIVTVFALFGLFIWKKFAIKTGAVSFTHFNNPMQDSED